MLEYSRGSHFYSFSFYTNHQKKRNLILKQHWWYTASSGVDGWMDGSSLPVQSKLDSAVRMEDVWGRICKILTKSFRGHHAVCTCFHIRQTQALSFSKASSTEHVVDLNLTLKFSQQTPNMQKEISHLQREGENVLQPYSSKNSTLLVFHSPSALN